MKEKIVDSIDKYLSETATQAEYEFVEALLKEYQCDASLVARWTEEEKESSRLKMWDQISKSIEEKAKRVELTNTGIK